MESTAGFVVLHELKTMADRKTEKMKQEVPVVILFFIPKKLNLLIVNLVPFNSYPAKFLIIAFSED